ncbi:MAG TPA: MFS transporter [Longimicrobium sp.]|nr:MFS transporter [Longimicrobium sp.]
MPVAAADASASAAPASAESTVISGRWFYGWTLVVALGVTETVSYGILQYAFPVFIAPMGAELGWSMAAVTGALSLATLVSAAAAVPAGRWVDRHGPRGLMTAGSILAALLLLAWSRVRTLEGFYLLSAGLGLAMAAVLYEPAFAVVASWFHRLRGRALTVLTFIAGFASVIFVPLATGLVDAHGWRQALVWLAAILAVTTIPPHALLLRRRPEDLGLHPDGAPSASFDSLDGAGEPSVSARAAVRTRSFAWLAAAFSLSALAGTAVAVHLIPLLLERGHTPAFAGAVLGMVGLMALPGRLVFTPLGGRWPRAAVTAAIFALQGLGIAALMLGEGTAGVWAFVVLFGAGFGAITPARAALVAELYGRASFGAVNGTLALLLALARAAAPIGASLLYLAGGGYPLVLAVLAALSFASAAAVLGSGRPHPHPIASTA